MRDLTDPDAPVYAGCRRRLHLRFADADGNGADPDALTLALEAPDGAETSFTLADCTRTDAGEYYLDHVFDAPGRWRLHLQATGAVAEALRACLVVEP